MNRLFIAGLFLIICFAAFSQNMLVKFYRDLPATIWENSNGIPQLTIAEYQPTASGTFTAPWSTNWTLARFNEHKATNEPLYNAWYASVKNADLLVISNNLVTLQNLYSSNVLFMFTVSTNRPAVTFTNGNLTISNQIVTLSRLFNQLAPALKLLYKGD